MTASGYRLGKLYPEALEICGRQASRSAPSLKLIERAREDACRAQRPRFVVVDLQNSVLKQPGNPQLAVGSVDSYVKNNCQAPSGLDLQNSVLKHAENNEFITLGHSPI
mgnify:CR=1 FL=1